MWRNGVQLYETARDVFGIGEYNVTVDLPQSGGLYQTSVVTYRGTDVGQVKSVNVTATGVRAVLALRSGVKVPADVQASVHSRSAIGEQYIELTPLPGKDAEHSRLLRNGDVIPAGRVDVPVDIGHLLDLTNRALQAIPRDNLRTVIDETNRAVGGLGPELSRIVDGSAALAIKGGQTVDSLAPLIDQSPAVLNSQVQTSDEIGTWAHRTAAIFTQFKAQDAALRDLLTQGTSGLEESRAQLDRVTPALPVLFANLVSLGDIAVVYRHDIEQLLVLLPQGIAAMAAIVVPSSNTKQELRGAQLDFNLNINLPPPCTTGYLPPTQRRSPVSEDAPDRPRQTCIAGCRRTPISMSVGHATFRARPSRGSVPPPSRCVKATRSTCRSTRAITGRATRTPPTPARVCRSIRRDRIRDYPRRGEPRRRPRRSRLAPTTRPAVSTSGPTGVGTTSTTWLIRVRKNWQQLLVPPP